MTSYADGSRLSLGAYAHYRQVGVSASEADDRRKFERRVDVILVGESPYRTKTAVNLVTVDQPSETGWTKVDEVPPTRQSVPNSALPDR